MATWPAGLRVRIFRGKEGPGAVYLPTRNDDERDVALYPFGGVGFTDDRGRNADEAPEAFTVPHDYPPHHHWFEPVNPSVVVRPAGPADQPFAKQHDFPQAEAFILHMADGDYRYRVVHQPDKYDDETGEPSMNAGDPTTHVDWFFVCELEGKV